MGAQIAKHNGKLMKKTEDEPSRPPPKCNCQKSKQKDCPLPGSCNQDGVVYQATVNNSVGNKKHYVGLAKKIKNRWRKHKGSILKKNLKTPPPPLLIFGKRLKKEGILKWSGKF